MSSPEASPGTNSPASPPPPPPPVSTNGKAPPTPANDATIGTAPAPSNSSTLHRDDGISRATLVGLVMGTVLGGLLMLIFLGICAFCYKRRKRRKMRQQRFNNYSATSSQPPKADQFGGVPQQWHPNITPPKPTPPPGVGLNQQPEHSSTKSSLGAGRPYHAPSPGIAFGLSQSTFTYDELARAADGFSSSNLLGQGGFGYVHKGVLPNGKTVAIKQLKSGSGQGEREFQAEVEVISRVHHRHLVSLVGYCIAGSQRMLVYEFVPNKTLEFHLHGKDRPAMDWPTRMKIAIGLAKGLAYLHEDCHPKIIHRDIKASNILLDDSFEAKVSDFGLAKFSPDADTHVSTRVMGTFGYLAPEYAASGKLTDKSDVFSFGVVLLELITGQKPVDKSQIFTDDSMVEWARPLLSQALENGNFDPLVDQRLHKDYNSDEVTRMVACAASCVRYSARHRPRMSQVVRALEGNLALDDLNDQNSTPGHSRGVSSFEGSNYDTGQFNEDLKKFKKLALEGLDQSTGAYSGPSSEYSQHPYTSSSGDQQISQETEIGNINSNT